MKKRNSEIFGNSVEKNSSINLNVITKFPEKWILIDSETGQMYQGTDNKKVGKNWKLLNKKNVIKKLKKLLLHY